MIGMVLDRILSLLARLSERTSVWHKWPFLLALGAVIGHRVNLRNRNLSNTETAPPHLDRPTDPNLPDDFDWKGWRTPDGSFNDLADPWMGRKSQRFARNVPLSSGFAEKPDRLMDPNPRLISNELLARKDFVPVPYLNLLAAAWIQFMVHDWLGHGPNDTKTVHTIPLPAGDDWPPGKMQVLATGSDTNRGPHDEGRPVTYQNAETHWWDGSQLYGSSWDRMERLRRKPAGARLKNGKLYLDRKGLLPLDEELQEKRPGQELSGVNGNWWIGLSLLHTLFAREHNAIVDRLSQEHTNASGEWLFQKARLVNAALMAKIHTVEWTPALMDSPVGRMAMRGNYWGLMGEHISKAFGRVSDSELVSGIPGSPTEHHGAPFAMTEEFTSLYRFHSLLPDEFEFRSAADDRHLCSKTLHGVAFGEARSVYSEASFDDALYTFATANPGALVLHNFPNTLRALSKKPEGGFLIDLAAVDILRDRERGVPRYAELRRLIGATPPKRFEDITSIKDDQDLLRKIYQTVDDVDLLVGCLAEFQSPNQPPGFGFSDTAFRVFILMASRRLNSDRFFSSDYRPEVYTQAGFAWVEDNGFKDVVGRHAPALAPLFEDARNAFFPWSRAKA